MPKKFLCYHLRESFRENFNVMEERVIIMSAVNWGMSYINSLNRNNAAAQRTALTIATGSMIPNVSANPSGYAASVRLGSNILAAQRSIQNTRNMSDMIKTASGATQNTVSALNSIRERLINAANDTNNSFDRRALQEDINQLVSQINENANAEYNGKRLLDGSQRDLTLAGIDGYENFQLGDMSSKALGLTDAEGNVTIDTSTPEAATESLDVVNSALDTAEYQSDSLDVAQSLADNDSALDRALDELTTQGAQSQRFELQEKNYEVQEENMLYTESTINGADLHKQVTLQRNQQIQGQLSLAVLRMQLEQNTNSNAAAVKMFQ